MTPRAPRKAAERPECRDEIRGLLLNAIEEVVAEGSSFTEVSVANLVDRAGISRSTFYVYFKDKGELLRSGFEVVIEEMHGSAEQWFAIGADSTRQDLRDAINRIVSVYRPHTALISAADDSSSYDSEIRERINGVIEHNLGRLASHIERGQAGGWIDPTLLPRETASWMIAAAERGQQQLTGPALESEVPALVDALADLLWSALYETARRQP